MFADRLVPHVDHVRADRPGNSYGPGHLIYLAFWSGLLPVALIVSGHRCVLFSLNRGRLVFLQPLDIFLTFEGEDKV